MEKNSLKVRYTLAIILFAALLIRIVGLDKVPPELFGDELDVGYQAYSLLSTAKDYKGQTLPMYIHSFSEWRAPLLMYVTVPFVAIFGLNEWGTRLPSVFFGVLAILFLYLLVKKTSGNIKIALLSALFLAISPWHIQYSRAAFEVSLLLALLFSAAYFFMLSFERPKFIQTLRKPWNFSPRMKQSSEQTLRRKLGVFNPRLFIFLSAIIFSLTFYTYSTAVLFTPLIISLLVYINRKDLGLLTYKNIVLAVIIFLVALAPIVYNIFFGFAAQRYSQFSVFSDPEISHEIDIKRSEGGNVASESIFHNKPISWVKKIISNYTSAFSPQFLFKEGDVTFRHSIHNVGEFYWIELPIILLGLFVMASKRGNFNILFILWLIIAPIPSSITKDGAVHATRLILMLPAITVIAATGFEYLLVVLSKKRIVMLFISTLFLLEFSYYLHSYFVDYPRESWRWWHQGYKEAMLYMKSIEGSYDKVVFNNTYEPALIRFLFWWKYSPEKFNNIFTGDAEKSEILPDFNGFSLEDRYYFGYIGNDKIRVENFVDNNTLYLVSHTREVGGDWDWGKNPPGNINVLKTIRSPFNDPIFYIVTAK